MIHSMTSGNPLKLIFLFAIPLVLGNLFQQMYILSDLYILGHYLGIHAVAVVGAMTPAFMMAIMMSNGFTNGLCVITAQRFGAKDFNRMRQSFGNGILLTFLFCTCIVVIIQLNLNTLLNSMNVPTDIYVDSGRFLSVLVYSLFAMLFYNYLSGIMRAVGDSQTPLYFLIISSVLNIVINIVIVAVLKFDVAGAAVGTGIAQLISVILCASYLFWKFPLLRLRKEDFQFDWEFVWAHLKIAFPMSVQFSIIGLGIIIVQSICNSFGTDTIAAFASALRIEQIATMPLFSLGVAITTYTAQNYGGRYIRRIRQGVFQCFLVAMGYSLGMAIVMHHFASSLAGIFLKEPSENVLIQAIDYIQISASSYIFIGMIFVFRQTLQGMGYPILPLVSGIFELIMRGFAAFYLAEVYGYLGICYASPIAWIGGAVIVSTGYFVIIRRFKVSLFGKLNQRMRIPKELQTAS